NMPDSLPDEPPRAWPAGLAQDTPVLRLLARCFSGTGQAYLQAAELVLEKPLTHETAYLLLNLLGDYFRAGSDVVELDGFSAEAAALAALAQLNAGVAAPILTRTTAVGPLMRRHLEPLFAPIIENIKILRGET
ncbi:MAG: hypothetical protein Q7U32_09440, partial [Rhodocyclaceae bacterium]|nr:hypothetical protein [Rhodocyclaceae bacterium]